MNYWTEISIEYANQKSYLDDLFKVYPTIPEGIREIDEAKWQSVEIHFNNRDHVALVKELLAFPLFPIKDGYVAYLKRDPNSILRNPNTVNRLCGRLYEMGLNEIFKKSTEPKETNRQMGSLFNRWVANGSLGLDLLSIEEFASSSGNAIAKATDTQITEFAKLNLNYNHGKKIDFLARFNGKYIIVEAKFLTDFGGHQNAQFNDAISTITSESSAIKVALLDGVLYIKGKNKMRKFLEDCPESYNIMSALVFRDFLYSL